MGLLMRLWNGIAHDFEPETSHVGHRDESGEDVVPGCARARGYRHAIRLAREGWSRILHDEREELVRYIPIVAGRSIPPGRRSRSRRGS